MCHMYADPDLLVKATQEAIAKEVVDRVMEKHSYLEMVTPTRVTHMGLVFNVCHPVDIRSDSTAGEIIRRELEALGFIGVAFYDTGTPDLATSIEYTLASHAKADEYRQFVKEGEPSV